MSLKQRSSDFLTAGCINQMQYLVLQHLVARHLGIEVGKFTWQYDNIQIYDRHIDQAIEMIERAPIECHPKIEIAADKNDFYDIGVGDIDIKNYPKKLIKSKNPQLQFPIGI
jgi:thymidylate synthase